MSATANVDLRGVSPELMARAARALRRLDESRQDATPGALAQRLDPLIVQTPALEVISQELVCVRDALRVMFKRRKRFAEYSRQGMALEPAIELVEQEIPDAGNRRLLISMPPQEGKTTAIGRYGILWLLMQFPGLRLAIVSYDGRIAGEVSYLARGDIALNDGTAGNPDLGLRLVKDSKAISRFRLAAPHEGSVYAIGIGGGIAGRPLDLLVIDDVVKDDEAASSEVRSSKAWLWWEGVGRTRLSPWAPVIGVGTRWHEADLQGRLAAKQEQDEAAGLVNIERWRTINIPAQADHHPERGEMDILGREPGEFMVSARGRTREQWETVKHGMSTRMWTALYQGKPSPDIGEVWLKTWWRRYDEPRWQQRPDGTFRLPGVTTALLSIDCAFKDRKDSDYVTMGVWGKWDAETYLIYQVWARLSFTDTCSALKRVAGLFPDCHRKLIEDKANGTAVIDSLKKTVPGIIPILPVQHKRARAEAVSPFIRAGNVYLPTPQLAVMDPELAWDVDAFITEATGFPNAAHDDQVDQASQALAELYLTGGVGSLHVPQGEIPRTGQASTPDRALASLPPHLRKLHRRQFGR
jgi:predicted phage terminase large subunit-like protein